MALHLLIVSPEQTLFDGSIKRVLVPGTQGQFEVLENHAAIISSLTKGNIVYEELNAEKHNQNITSGFIEVADNCVNICVEL